MSRDPHATLQHLLEDQLWDEALTQVDKLLEANPLAAQLHLLRGQLIQLQDENTPYSLEDTEQAFQRAAELDTTYFDAIVELMHFYDAVCPDAAKAIEYAKQVKALAQKALTEAYTILERTDRNTRLRNLLCPQFSPRLPWNIFTLEDAEMFSDPDFAS